MNTKINEANKAMEAFVKWTFDDDPNYTVNLKEDCALFLTTEENQKEVKFNLELLPLYKGKTRGLKDAENGEKITKLTGNIIFTQDSICNVKIEIAENSKIAKNVKYEGFAVQAEQAVENGEIKRTCWLFVIPKTANGEDGKAEKVKFGEIMIMCLDVNASASIYIGQVLTTDSHLFNPHLFKFLMYEKDETVENFIKNENDNLEMFTRLAPKNIYLKHEYSKHILDLLGKKNREKTLSEDGNVALKRLIDIFPSSTNIEEIIRDNFTLDIESPDGITTKTQFRIIEKKKKYTKLEVVEPQVIGFSGKGSDSQLFALLLSWIRGQEETDDFENKYASRGVSIINNSIHPDRPKQLNHLYGEWLEKETKESQKERPVVQRNTPIKIGETWDIFKSNRPLLSFLNKWFGDDQYYKYSFKESKSLFAEGKISTTLHYTSILLGSEDASKIQRGVLTLTKEPNGLCSATLNIKRTSEGFTVKSKGFAIVTNPDNLEKSDCWVFLKAEKTINNDIEISKEGRKNTFLTCLNFSLYPTNHKITPRFSARVGHGITTRASDGVPTMFRTLLTKEYLPEKNISMYFYPFIRMQSEEMFIEERFYDDFKSHLKNYGQEEPDKIYNNPSSINTYNGIDEHFGPLLEKGKDTSIANVKRLQKMINPSAETTLGFKRNRDDDDLYTEIELKFAKKDEGFNPIDITGGNKHSAISKIWAWLLGMDNDHKPRSISAVRSHTSKQRHIDVENLCEWVNSNE